MKILRFTRTGRNLSGIIRYAHRQRMSQGTRGTRRERDGTQMATRLLRTLPGAHQIAVTAGRRPELELGV